MFILFFMKYDSETRAYTLYFNKLTMIKKLMFRNGNCFKIIDIDCIWKIF